MSDASLRENLFELLEYVGYRPLAAQSWSQAHDLLHASKVDLILAAADIGEPNGAVSHVVKEDPYRGIATVIMCDASIHLRGMEKRHLAPISVLEMPFEADDIVRKIKETLSLPA